MGRRRQRARPLVLPTVNGVRLTAAQATVLETAAALAKGGLESRRTAARMVREVERELAAARMAARVAEGVAETIALERARGAAFDQEPAVEAAFRRNEDGSLARDRGRLILDSAKVTRTRRVDGLISLHRAGALSDGELQTADRCRALMAKAAPPVRSALGVVEGVGGGVADTGRLAADAYERAQAGLTVAGLRQAIETAAGARALAVFDAVVGRGVSIRSLGAGGDLNERNRDLLKAAICACAAKLSD